MREVLSLLWLTLILESRVYWHRLVLEAQELVWELTDDDAAPLTQRIAGAAAGWADLRGTPYDATEQERIAHLQRSTEEAHDGLRAFLTTMALQGETDR